MSDSSSSEKIERKKLRKSFDFDDLDNEKVGELDNSSDHLSADSDDSNNSDPWVSQVRNLAPLNIPDFPIAKEVEEEFIEEYLFRVVSVLKSGETPKAAMDRFLGKPVKASWKSTIKKKKMEPQIVPGEANMEGFDRLTEALDRLTSKGWPEIILTSRENILETKCSKVWLEFLRPDGTVSEPIPMNKFLGQSEPFRHAKRKDQTWRQFDEKI